MTYSAEQFTQLAEAKLYHYQQQHHHHHHQSQQQQEERQETGEDNCLKIIDFRDSDKHDDEWCVKMQDIRYYQNNNNRDIVIHNHYTSDPVR